MGQEDHPPPVAGQAEAVQNRRPVPTLESQTAIESPDLSRKLHRPVTLVTKLASNLPYGLMLLFGVAVFVVTLGGGLLAWLVGGLYLAYGLGGVVWIILFLCPHCHFYNTQLCPCGYGEIAAKLRSPKDASDFAHRFKRHIAVIVPLWFIPVIIASIGLYRHFSWLLLALLLMFAVDSFVVLPLVSTRYGCSHCPQRTTCPWMRHRAAVTEQ